MFARSLTRLQYFLSEINCKNKWAKKNFNEFKNYNYDVIINCVGLGTPSKVKDAGYDIFSLTEKFDNMIIEYLVNRPKTLYINFSSGAVYGSDFASPVNNSTFSKWNINNIKESDYYGMAKLNSEAKHRALKKFNIVDLRVFGYFSRFMDIDMNYFLGEIILCLKSGKVFETNGRNITRDFIHPTDIFLLVEKCILKRKINDAFDVYSKKPITKFEILNFFKKKYKLKYLIKESKKIISVTGIKDNYFSLSRKAKEIGYKSYFSSLDCISMETNYILENW